MRLRLCHAPNWLFSLLLLSFPCKTDRKSFYPALLHFLPEVLETTNQTDIWERPRGIPRADSRVLELNHNYSCLITCRANNLNFNMQYCTWKQGYTTSFYYSSFITKSKTIPSIIWTAVSSLFMYHGVELLLRKTTCDLPIAELWEDCLWQLASLRGPSEFLMMGKSLFQHNLYKKLFAGKCWTVTKTISGKLLKRSSCIVVFYAPAISHFPSSETLEDGLLTGTFKAGEDERQNRQQLEEKNQRSWETQQLLRLNIIGSVNSILKDNYDSMKQWRLHSELFGFSFNRWSKLHRLFLTLVVTWKNTYFQRLVKKAIWILKKSHSRQSHQRW